MTAADIAAIELVILSRLRASAAGSHRGVLDGAGLERAGLHAWQSGDRIERVDWAQSSLTGFSPLMVRDFEQDSQASIVVLADISLSTRYGGHGATVAGAIERIAATVGVSAALGQDLFGVVTFDADLHARAVARPAGGRSHVRHCLEICATPPRQPARAPGRVAAAAAACLRHPGFVVVASDFLMANVERFVAELERLAAVHDVLALMVDARDAFTLPAAGAGWVRVRSAETSEVRLVSAHTLASMPASIAAAQERALAAARRAGIDAIAVPTTPALLDATIVDAIAARRLSRRCA